ncbi:hypothetical protein [Streptomyces sp. WZ-12]|uniref:hypothetical protein n=1 Tax=Streptomyces sp. WZ-12 TaxID=3030210 RepID=UPI0023815826|nr:hypothetical protein [Streptomyces sp. WZ-12]
MQGATASVDFGTGTPVTTPAADASGTAVIADNTFTYPDKSAAYNATATATGHPSGTATVTIRKALGLQVNVGTGANWNKAGATVTGLMQGATASVDFGTGTPVTTPAADASGTAVNADNTFTYPDKSAAYNATATATGHPSGTATVTIRKALGLQVNVGTGANWNKAGATVTGLMQGATASVDFGTGTPVTTPAADASGTAVIADNTFTYPDKSAAYNATATATGHGQAFRITPVYAPLTYVTRDEGDRSWSSPQIVPGPTTDPASPPALAEHNGKLYCVYFSTVSLCQPAGLDGVLGWGPGA